MPQSQLHILIVEDDTVDRLACKRAITGDASFSFVLHEAATGRDGLELIARQRIDCILLDYHLPDLNGLEFLSELTSAHGTMPAPVLLLTGADSAAVVAAAMKRGAWDYLGKDLDGNYLELLPSAIQRMVRERRLAEEKRAAEAQFRSLVEQIEAITYTASLGEATHFQYISPQIKRLGFSAGEWILDPGLHFRQIHPDDGDEAIECIMRSRSTGNALRHEYRLVSRNGEVLWFRDEAKAVTDEQGRKLFLQGILVDITQSKQAEQALLHSQAELRQLAGHLETAKEAERKRIAQEIHDELGGLFTGIKAYISVYVERLKRAGTAPDPLLMEVASLADNGFQAVRRVITDLRPSVLDQLGIWTALEWYANQIEKRSGLECECSIEDQLAEMEIEPEVSTMLFRIAQEALTNTVRHADASKVTIHAGLDSGSLTLEIRDDGKGIGQHSTENSESWGIVGMHERARYFGGELSITGEAGRGTLVRLRLPMEELRTNE
ncbi:response regulator [Oxalobacteraceae bacterium R-40]|uniref:Response regulator n=1 Tax=Keguizhuia sedimenti TaxID=3064264 RepID=A0ABU1BQ77_9BURK|nr:response regulator [Oxalobacteraceae bacterium R-40]